MDAKTKATEGQTGGIQRPVSARNAETLAVLLSCETKDAVPWPVFLAALAEFCDRQGWILEYETVEDESCAIFYQP